MLSRCPKPVWIPCALVKLWCALMRKNKTNNPSSERYQVEKGRKTKKNKGPDSGRVSRTKKSFQHFGTFKSKRCPKRYIQPDFQPLHSRNMLLRHSIHPTVVSYPPYFHLSHPSVQVAMTTKRSQLPMCPPRSRFVFLVFSFFCVFVPSCVTKCFICSWPLHLLFSSQMLRNQESRRKRL